MSDRRIRGITWDHARGFDPLHEGAKRFMAQHPGVSIEWERRSLSRFGVESIQALSEEFDLVVIDHPFCGEAASSQCLLDLSSLLPQPFLQALLEDSVGPSSASYCRDGAVWALPTDAAAQVASCRRDLLEGMAMDMPRTFEEVLSLGRRARTRGLQIALPLGPDDAACVFFTLLANLGCRPGDEPPRDDLDPGIAEEALTHLVELSSICHPSSTKWNPIQTYEAMTSSDEIAYVPFAFGYSNYARPGVKKSLRFGNIAGPGKDPQAGALLGGAGCAVSRGCRDLPLAVEYLSFLHSPDHQRGVYFDAGGQPGLLSAWRDERVNQASGRFFLDTFETLQKSYRRPRFDGFVPFMKLTGNLVHDLVVEGKSPHALALTFSDAYDRARGA